MKKQISGHNIARDLSVTVDVGFCQIGKYQAICFAARFNAAMRQQSDLLD